MASWKQRGRHAKDQNTIIQWGSTENFPGWTFLRTGRHFVGTEAKTSLTPVTWQYNVLNAILLRSAFNAFSIPVCDRYRR